MKKYVSLLLCVLLAAGLASACAAVGEGTAAQDGKLRIIATVFPAYDWTKEVLGDNASHAELRLLIGDGVDMHSYQPSVEDIVRICECDMFIYTGGQSDAWVQDVLKDATNKEMLVINLLEALEDGAKAEESVEGMQAEEHAHGEEGEEHAQAQVEYDEHIWLSLRNAEKLSGVIAEGLASIDSENAQDYAANAASYAQKLSALDAAYKDAVAQGARKTLLFADRFPFRYLVDDYDLNYYAAFSGCSAETEAAFETIAFLSAKVDELALPCVLTLEGSEHKIAETIISNTKNGNEAVLVMDSMQSTTLADANGGASYLSIMEKNLAALKEALS